MLSPLCQEFLQKLDIEINDFKERIETFIETNRDSKDLYNLIDKEFGEEVDNFKEKYGGKLLSLVDKNTSNVVMLDLECDKVMKQKYLQFLTFIDDVNTHILTKDNKS